MAAVCNGIGATTFESKLQLEAMQTVSPMKQTDPRLSVRILAAESLGSSIFKTCFNIVFCYNKASEEDSGSLVTGWIKESLGRALSEQPILAGRLKRKDDGEGDLEIVSNDSGVRLIEAQFAMTLQEFLDLQEKKEAEAELVFWEDIDHEINPQFSPLFYIQVSSFKCGGYSIGISCSLLLLDPFAMISFLKRWTSIHIKMISESDMPKIPTFYRPNLRNTGPSPGLPIGSSIRAHAGQNVIFNIATKILNLDGEIHKNIAALCIDEAGLKLGQKTASKYSLFVKEESSEDVKVQSFTREGFIDQKPSATVNGITSATWDDLGTANICFNEGNKPAYVSCWINSVVDEAFVMIIPSPEKDSAGMKVILTFPI